MRRPLPPPVETELVRLACHEPAPELLVRGIEEFRAGQYFACHETLERLWRQEPRPVRQLYQGILLVGVALYKVCDQRNYTGALSLIDRGLAYLQGFPDHCHGLDIATFRCQAERCRAELERLGPRHFHLLDQSFVPALSPATSP